MSVDNFLSAIKKVFEDHHTIPVYQRNYAWGKEEIETLLEDLKDTFTSGADEYFLGNLVVEKHENSEHNNYMVVDGQQRLTTLYMLLCYLGYKDHRKNFSMELRSESNALLKKLSENYTSDQDFKDAQTLYEGFIHIKKWFEKQENHKDVNKKDFLNNLLEKVKLAYVVLPPEMDANRYFEVMNNRGQQLSQVDVVKARLMAKLATPEEQAKFALIWDACSQMDAHILTAFSPAQRKPLEALWEKEVEGLTLESLDLTTEPNTLKATSKTRNLDEALEHYSNTTVFAEMYDDEEKYSGSFGLAIIPFPYFLLHALKIFLGEQDKGEQLLDDKKLIERFSKAFLTEQNSAEGIRKFIIFLLKARLLFDTYVIRRIGEHNDELDWQLKRVILKDSGKEKYQIKQYNNTFDDEVNKNLNKTLIMLQSMLRTTYTSFKIMHWITDFLKVALKHYPNEDALTTALLKTLRNYAQTKVCQAFEHGMPTGTNTPHIVFTYLDFLLWEQDKNKWSNFRFRFRNSVEHFYPQHPNPEMNLPSLMPEVLNCLGNLALITTSANSRFSNQSPEEKAKYHNTDQSLKLQLMAEQATKWGGKTICQHCNEILEILRKDLLNERCHLPAKCEC